MAEHPAVMGRVADRCADVATQFEASQSGGQGRGGPARRAARTSCDIPWIVRRAVDRIESLPVGQKRGHIGFAEYDCTRVLQAPHREGILFCDIALHVKAAPGRWMVR